MPLTVKMVGALRHASGKKQLIIDYEKDISLRSLLIKISENMPELKQSLTSQQDAPKSNALILINGKEISVLNGLETKLHDGDEIVLIPVVHGG